MDFLHITRGIMLSLARFYELDDDEESFRRYYGLFEKARDYDKDHGASAAARVTDRIAAIKLICDRVPAGSGVYSSIIRPWKAPNPNQGKPIPNAPPDFPVKTIEMRGVVGLGNVKRLPVAASYVVFSDHHMTGEPNRQNFFTENKSDENLKSNKDLYLDILQNYYAVAGFDLIENGDVEELLIYEPEVKGIKGIGNWTWTHIINFRHGKIKESIRSVAKHNQDYYRTIYENFAVHGKYHKIVGNHDVALMDPNLMQLLRDETGLDFDDPVETVLLSDNSRHQYFICHGHQFDHSCTPDFAEHLGESYTQSGAWAFQGPDRSWLFDKDWLDDMLTGARPVTNNITGTEPTGLSAIQIAELVAAFSVGAVLGGPTVATALASGTLSTAMFEAIFKIVPPQNLFEEILGRNIAWEYFENPDDLNHLLEEITTTGRWFKFRHTEEIELTDFLANETTYYDGDGHFLKPWSDAEPPTVVIGHSHEARIESQRPNGKTASHYINTASAGRFENLIWGLEIVDGAPQIFTWHYDGDVPTRTLWVPQTLDLAGRGSGFLLPTVQTTLTELVAALNANAEPPDETNFRVAVLNTM